MSKCPVCGFNRPRKVAIYRHIMWGERQVCAESYTKSPDHPFGIRGRNFDPSFKVITTPLYALPEPK